MTSIASDPRPELAAQGHGPWRVEARATTRLALPLVLTNMSHQAMQTTDVLMIARLGPMELAASTLAGAVFWLFFLFLFGVISAGSGMMAQDLGRKRRSVREVRRTVRKSVWASLILFALFGPILWHVDLILTLPVIAQDPALIPLAVEYMRALMWCLPTAAVFFTLRGFVSVLERPNAALVVTVAAIAFNVFANWVLIFGNLGMPALGLTGAGLATFASSLFSVLFLAAWIRADRRFRRFHLWGRFWRADWEKLGELLRIGLPAGLTWSLEMGAFVLATFLMGMISVAQLAAHQIALQLPSLTFMVPMGLAMAATVRVGLAAGADDAARARRAGLVALAMGVGFMSVMAIAMWLFPDAIAALYLDADDPEVGEALFYTASFIAIAALFQVADGAQAIGQGALRGLKDTRMPMVIAFFGYWVIGLGLGWFLAFDAGMEGVGVWIGLAVGLGVVAIGVVIRFAMAQRLGLLPAGTG